MIDIDTAKDVDITVTRDGKIWVYVDGRCVLRVQRSDCVVVDDPVRGSDTVVGDPFKVSNDALDAERL